MISGLLFPLLTDLAVKAIRFLEIRLQFLDYGDFSLLTPDLPSTLHPVLHPRKRWRWTASTGSYVLLLPATVCDRRCQLEIG